MWNGGKCIDCDTNRFDILKTGSFQCEPCRRIFINRLNGKIKEDNLMESSELLIDKVRKLTNDGMKPKEIADRLGTSAAVVYNYQSKIRRENETAEKAPAPPQEAAPSGVSEEEYAKLVRAYTKLEKSWHASEIQRTAAENKLKTMEEQFNPVKKDHDRYLKNLRDLEARFEELQSNEQKLLEERDYYLEKMQQVQKDLNRMRFSPAEDSSLEEELQHERKKHKALLNYTLLVQREELANG